MATLFIISRLCANTDATDALKP